ncbi:SpdD protein [Streptomyces tropicalis]|uniref:SpdD protein n=1 Tax=Streptomyces tropicalis TaxID=3034234 RepID=A0ABT6A085_9ACTN|nr:SpdD protein [Streptomyces tropicalis]MDF3297873.1 SpdD protein [Streptomyces tropicalis]
MFRPKLPDIPTLPGPNIISTQQGHAPVPSAGRSLNPYVGAVAAVVVVGVVLTALLAAVAVTAVSVAIAAVVLRSLITGANKR